MTASSKASDHSDGWTELRNQLQGRSSISRRELAELIAQHVAVGTKYAIRRLCREGVLMRATAPARGLYLVGQASSHTDFVRDPVEAILTHLGRDIFFCYGTALFLHGLSRYGRLTDYYVGSEDSRNWREVGQVRLRLIKTPVDDTVGVIAVPYADLQIRVTNIERTLIDCIHRPKYAQGWENVLHAIVRIDTLDEERVYTYLKKYRLPSLVAKTCLILEHFSTKWGISDSILGRLHGYLPRSPVRIFRTSLGMLNKRWNVYVPEGFFPK